MKDKDCRKSYGKLVFGLFLCIVGGAWLGNETGLWKINLPWLPLMVFLCGLTLVAKWFSKE